MSPRVDVDYNHNYNYFNFLEILDLHGTC